MGRTLFEDCFRRHVSRLAALAEAATGDQQVARDLTQEAFVRLHRHWERVAGYDDIGAWLTHVLSNLIVDHQRSRSSERRALQRLAGRPATTPQAVGGDGDWDELIAGLPPRQQVIVTLHYGEDRSIAEIAAMLDIAPNSVKSGLSKARDTLRARGNHGT